jgi:hypothetical protein
MEDWYRKGSWILLGLGLFTFIGAGGTIASLWAEAIPPTRINSCEEKLVGRTHVVHVTTVDKREIQPNVYSCPHAEVIEKRRGEVNYRADGRHLGITFRTQSSKDA